MIDIGFSIYPAHPMDRARRVMGGLDEMSSDAVLSHQCCNDYSQVQRSLDMAILILC